MRKATGHNQQLALLFGGPISVLLAVALLFVSAPVLKGAPILVNGAGATFPYPIYSKWFSEYHKLHPDIQINYQSIGSGGESGKSWKAPLILAPRTGR
jgi:ABC-type phosphate transport system substrate-binding protein